LSLRAKPAFSPEQSRRGSNLNCHSCETCPEQKKPALSGAEGSKELKSILPIASNIPTTTTSEQQLNWVKAISRKTMPALFDRTYGDF